MQQRCLNGRNHVWVIGGPSFLDGRVVCLVCGECQDHVTGVGSLILPPPEPTERQSPTENIFSGEVSMKHIGKMLGFHAAGTRFQVVVRRGEGHAKLYGQSIDGTNHKGFYLVDGGTRIWVEHHQVIEVKKL